MRRSSPSMDTGRGGGVVVMPEEMEHPVYDEMRPVVAARLVLIPGLAVHHRRTQHDIPELAVRRSPGRGIERERKDVRRADEPAETLVQVPTFLPPHDAHGEVRSVAATLEGAADPSLHRQAPRQVAGA